VLINDNECIAATDIIAGGEMRLTLCAAAPMYSHLAGTCTRAQWRWNWAAFQWLMLVARRLASDREFLLELQVWGSCSGGFAGTL
jgi:hypothetical protein